MGRFSNLSYWNTLLSLYTLCIYPFISEWGTLQAGNLRHLNLFIEPIDRTLRSGICKGKAIWKGWKSSTSAQFEFLNIFLLTNFSFYLQKYLIWSWILNLRKKVLMETSCLVIWKMNTNELQQTWFIVKWCKNDLHVLLHYFCTKYPSQNRYSSKN